MIKGIHGLHVYATEYWTEYLLSEASENGGMNTDTCVASLASGLANKLEIWAPSNIPLGELDPGHSDKRLLLLRPYGTLQNHVKRSLDSRTTKQLERKFQSEQGKLRSLLPRILRS